MCFSSILRGVFSYRSIPSISVTVERLGTRHEDTLVAPVPGQHHDDVGYDAVHDDITILFGVQLSIEDSAKHAVQCHDHRDYIVSVDHNQHYPLMCL